MCDLFVFVFVFEAFVEEVVEFLARVIAIMFNKFQESFCIVW